MGRLIKLHLAIFSSDEKGTIIVFHNENPVVVKEVSKPEKNVKKEYA